MSGPWVAERWIVRAKEYGAVCAVAVEIRHGETGEERRNASETVVERGDEGQAEARCRAALQGWIVDMNEGTAVDRGIPSHTRDVLEGREMRA